MWAPWGSTQGEVGTRGKGPMTKDEAHRSKVPFSLRGLFFDYDSGEEIRGEPYEGFCLVGSSVFQTGVDRETGERWWTCVCP